MALEFLAVGLGGAFGSISRYLLTKLTLHYGAVFPWGTLLANTLAGILVGLVFALEKGPGLSPRMVLLLRTGFLGGLSTFSAFSLETIRLAQAGSYVGASLNVGLNLFLSLIGVLIGLSLAKTFLTS
ncbi:MAG: fluoride efflux transporter CrcB [Deltaproteobacteria bacterium]|nr:fluoride efflux transporter CrcB [Deltaproteobacteria bacterium]